nr:MAG TPA_asm: hypothetical protein [Bacteriophage sp.]
MSSIYSSAIRRCFSFPANASLSSSHICAI